MTLVIVAEPEPAFPLGSTKSPSELPLGSTMSGTRTNGVSVSADGEHGVVLASCAMCAILECCRSDPLLIAEVRIQVEGASTRTQKIAGALPTEKLYWYE